MYIICIVQEVAQSRPVLICSLNVVQTNNMAHIQEATPMIALLLDTFCIFFHHDNRLKQRQPLSMSD